jgi:hypothetical protein
VCPSALFEGFPGDARKSFQASWLTFTTGGFEEADGAYPQFGQAAHEIAEAIALRRGDGDGQEARMTIVDQLRGLDAKPQIMPSEGGDGGECASPGAIREADLVSGRQAQDGTGMMGFVPAEEQFAGMEGGGDQEGAERHV